MPSKYNFMRKKCCTEPGIRKRNVNLIKWLNGIWCCFLHIPLTRKTFIKFCSPQMKIKVALFINVKSEKRSLWHAHSIRAVEDELALALLPTLPVLFPCVQSATQGTVLNNTRTLATAAEPAASASVPTLTVRLNCIRY